MLYFAADIAALQGHDRDKSRELYRDSRIYPALQYLTLFFGLQFILKAFKIYFISVFGVDGYGEMRAIMTAVGWGISICIGIGFVWVNNKIHAVTEEKSLYNSKKLVPYWRPQKNICVTNRDDFPFKFEQKVISFLSFLFFFFHYKNSLIWQNSFLKLFHTL